MRRNNLLYSLFPSLFAFIFLFLAGCDQYEYSSPSPGVIEVLLRTKSTKIAFSALNNYVISIPESQLLAVRSDGAVLQVLQDINAITRKEARYNVIQPNARDSSLILGQVYAPPGTYRGLTIQITPGSTLYLYGYQDIGVTSMLENTLYNFIHEFKVQQNETTYVTLTFDLDQSLSRRADDYAYTGVYYISSVETYRHCAVSGHVYNDANGNSLRESGEPGIANWKVYLSNGSTDSAVTNSDGFYSFTNLKPQSYMLSETVAGGWVQTFPVLGVHVFPLKSGEVATGKDFGNFYLGSN